MKTFQIALLSLCSVGFARAQNATTLPSNDTAADERLLSLHRSIVEIDSTTGSELAVGNWLENFFESLNWTVELQPVAANRNNILAYPPGVEGGKSQVLLTSHYDTVPPYIPYSLKDNNTTIWGRGTADAKGSVATQITAALNILNRTDIVLPPDALAVLYVVGEEGTADGMKYFNLHKPHNYSSIIFGEPTEGDLVCGHKGALGMSLNVTGKTAHSGYPELGVDANAILVRTLTTLYGVDTLPSSEKFGNTTVNVGLIQGGVAVNVVSGSSLAGVAIRLAASTPEQVKAQLIDALSNDVSSATSIGGNISFGWPIAGYPPQEISCDVEGFNTSTVNYGTDIPYLEGPHKKYLYGPGSIQVSHGPNEHVTVAELKEAVAAYEKIILHALGL